MDRKSGKYPKRKTQKFSKGPKRPFKCNPSCKYGHFRCAQKHLGRKFRNQKGWWVYDCRYVEDAWCEGSSCKYAFCNVRKMKADGTCGIHVRPKEKKDWDEEDEEFESEVDIQKLQKKSKIKIQERAIKKFKKFEDY